MESGATPSTNDESFIAYGLLVSVFVIIVSYVVLTVWPKNHLPRLFSFLAAIACVSALYVFKVPGSAFGLGALGVVAFFVLISPQILGVLFEQDHPVENQKPHSSSSEGQMPMWPIAFGTLIGLALSAVLVSALIMPPALLADWIANPEPVDRRVKRALDPGEDWVVLSKKEFETSEKLRRATAELADTKKRLGEADAALSKAQDELGKFTSNTVRGIVLGNNSASRHANGAIYVGVKTVVTSGNFCAISVSSDTVEKIEKHIKVGESVSIASSKGKFRLVLTNMRDYKCFFDLVKD